MAKGDHRVTPNGEGRWKHAKDGNERASGIYDTQKEAWDAAQEGARRDKTEVFLHGENGRIRERNSFGNDPCPPRDKK